MSEISLIAPCGINCGLCIVYQEGHKCKGCNSTSEYKPKHCVTCSIKTCEKRIDLDSGYCYECQSFPCKVLKKLDRRYRSKYGVSVLDNLVDIKTQGNSRFLKSDNRDWTCPGCGLLYSMHRGKCLHCGMDNPHTPS